MDGSEPGAVPPRTQSSPVKKPARARWLERLRVEGAGNSPSEGLLDRLASMLRLDVYGDEGLTRRARIEMGFAGLLLLALFLFDLGAWFLFFRLIFGPAGAGAAALLPTLVTFVYERQFLTADTTGGARGWLRLMPAFAIRVAIIVVVSLVTAQPVELFIFKDRIQARLHEESVRAEAVRRQQSLMKAIEKAQKRDLGEELDGSPQARRLVAAKKELAAAMKDQAGADARLLPLKKRIPELRSELRSLGRELRGETDPRREKRLRGSIYRLRDQLDRATHDSSEAESQVATARAAAEVAQKDRDEAKTDLDARQKELEARDDSATKEGELTQDRLVTWIAKVHAAAPGQPVYEYGNSEESNRLTKPGTSDFTKGFEFRDGDYDFFLRLETLADLRNARPPRWPDSSGKLRATLSQVYGLEDLAESDGYATARRAQEAADFTAMWRLVFLAAMVIPLLVIAMKFLMPPELKAYYMNAYQAAAGNPETVEYRDAMRRMKDAA